MPDFGRARGRAGVTLRVGALLLVLAAPGCGTVSSYLRLPSGERRLFEVYSAFMTSAQQTRYLAQRTAAARREYAESLGLTQRLAALPEAEREAVLNGVLRRDMSADALLMAWGHPYSRSRLGEADERWIYLPYTSRHLTPSAGVDVYLRDGRVVEWAQFVIPAPEGVRGR